MQCHRIEELLELLQPAWIKEQDLSLVQFVAKLAEEAGFDRRHADLSPQDAGIRQAGDDPGSGQGSRARFQRGTAQGTRNQVNLEQKHITAR